MQRRAVVAENGRTRGSLSGPSCCRCFAPTRTALDVAEVHAEADDIDPALLAEAMSRLERHGVIVACGETVVAARCVAPGLDELGMVSI
jgi:hypothetical protein